MNQARMSGKLAARTLFLLVCLAAPASADSSIMEYGKEFVYTADDTATAPISFDLTLTQIADLNKDGDWADAGETVNHVALVGVTTCATVPTHLSCGIVGNNVQVSYKNQSAFRLNNPGANQTITVALKNGIGTIFALHSTGFVVPSQQTSIATFGDVENFDASDAARDDVLNEQIRQTEIRLNATGRLIIYGDPTANIIQNAATGQEFEPIRETLIEYTNVPGNASLRGATLSVVNLPTTFGYDDEDTIFAFATPLGFGSSDSNLVTLLADEATDLNNDGDFTDTGELVSFVSVVLTGGNCDNALGFSCSYDGGPAGRNIFVWHNDSANHRPGNYSFRFSYANPCNCASQSYVAVGVKIVSANITMNATGGNASDPISHQELRASFAEECHSPGIFCLNAHTTTFADNGLVQAVILMVAAIAVVALCLTFPPLGLGAAILVLVASIALNAGMPVTLFAFLILIAGLLAVFAGRTNGRTRRGWF